ncbi:hypothetical protein ACFW04_009256 [Cataglyphis niger]
MGLPPTSPRFKLQAHSGNVSGSSAVPRRPPRQPPSPSTRSRSLELLDQQEQEQKISVSSAIVQRPPLPRPRPRSRSLDGLLDEDVKSDAEESCDEQNKAQHEKSHSLTNPEEDKIIPVSKENEKKPNAESIESKDEPRPVPRIKSKPDAVDMQSEMENARISSNKDENDKEILLTRPSKPSRYSSSEEQSSTSSSKNFGNQEHQIEKQRIRETAKERLMTRSNEEKDDYNDDKSTILLKASRSCGAGLDSDGNISSSEYGGSRARAKGPGSLLSLPTGAEPKRKRNFMDKCVNKVRSFMKK